MDPNELIEALESIMDEAEDELMLYAALESYDIQYALEAASGENTANIGSDIRSGFADMKKAAKSGDIAAAKAADAKIQDAANTMAAADSEADEEGKKKLSLAAKIGIAAAGALAAIVLGTAAGQMIGKNAVEKNKDIKGAAALICKVSNAIMRKIAGANQKITKRRFERGYDKKYSVYNKPDDAGNPHYVMNGLANLGNGVRGSGQSIKEVYNDQKSAGKLDKDKTAYLEVLRDEAARNLKVGARRLKAWNGAKTYQKTIETRASHIKK